MTLRQNYKYHSSTFPVFAVYAAAFAAAPLSLLKALTVVLHTLGFRAFAAFLNSVFLTVLHRVYVLTVLALAVSPADFPFGKAFAIFGPTVRFGAFAFYFSFDLRLF